MHKKYRKKETNHPPKPKKAAVMKKKEAIRQPKASWNFYLSLAVLFPLMAVRSKNKGHLHQPVKYDFY